MHTDRRELRDWFIITLIILIGFLCLIVAGSMAIRFSPSWKLAANMDSLLDPNSDFLTRRPQGFIEPVDESILTSAAWIGLFQTPGASVPERTPTPRPAITIAPVSTSTNVALPNNPATSTLDPTNTVVYEIPASPTNTSKPKPGSNTPTATLPVEADLQITKDDGVLMYAAGTTLTYTIVVTNNGPANVTDAIITDDIPAQFDNWTWNCTAQNGGAKGCDPAAGNNVDFSDTVDLPSGASIQYTVTANISTATSGDLTNTATISAPAGITESDLTNNSFSDTDQFIASAPFPVGNIGTTQDSFTETVKSGDSITFRFPAPLVVNGHAGYDLVYYELPNGTGIAMDLVVLAIGDGTNWYQIFNWGNGDADTNSNMNIAMLGGIENDNRDFTTPPASDILFNSTGILIELDGYVANGTYPYIRITSPAAGDLDGGCEVDAIVVLP